jgi:dTMP kinase
MVVSLRQFLAHARLAKQTMATRGKLIALEGIDGSGKRTQLDLLAGALKARGLVTFRISFPRYESFFGKLVGQYLNGKFGALEAVDPHLSALLYAGDRLEAKPEIEAALSVGKYVLADRYIASNMAHQSARVPLERREEFLEWLKRLEYGVYALPAEDLVIYLRVPVAEAHRLVGLKSAREYTTLQRDIQEADTKHLEQTAKIYERLATETNWASIDCINPASGGLLSPEEIHAAVLRVVETNIINQVSAGRT